MALTNATLPYAVQIANKGWQTACKENSGLKNGLNMVGDKITFKGVAEAFDLPYTPADSCL
jgi:alanine dehydrogenase